MKPGLANNGAAELTWVVGAADVIHLGAGQQQGAIVFSTPSMINLMEHAAREQLRPFLESDEESVGVTIQVEHLAATPIGAQVRAVARVTSIQGKLIDFEITAYDATEKIGRGTHRRAVIHTSRFAERLVGKMAGLRREGSTHMPHAIDSAELEPFHALIVGRDGAVLTVTLNRPQKLNAVNRQMTADWERLNGWLASHRDVRIVIVTGSGEAFCAGDDVTEVGTLSVDEATELSLRQARLYLEWERLPQIFIAAVNGLSLGGGCVMACACDFRIAAHSSRFGMPEILLGWPPGYGIAQLTALIGKSRALEMCVLGRQVSAQDAAAYGLVHDVVPLGRTLSAARQLAETITNLPQEALRETKRLIHQDEGAQPKIAYLADTAAYIRCLQLPDAREGIAAFGEKRSPRFEH